MANYEFSLRYALPDPDANPFDFVDALYEAGCDDAMIGTGKRGSIMLEFDREAATAEEAMRSAAACVERAIPGARLLEAKPDLVSLTDVAEILGCSRQNMRKYAIGEIKSPAVPFPEPVFTGTLSLWHLCEIADWATTTKMKLEPRYVEVSAAAFSFNLEAQLARLKPKEKDNRREARGR